jgi:hypothetical protein
VRGEEGEWRERRYERRVGRESEEAWPPEYHPSLERGKGKQKPAVTERGFPVRVI